MAEVDYVWTTVGYIIWPKGARKLLQRLPIDSPVDNFMSWASHTNHTVAYATSQPIIKQEAPWNIASNVEHSDEKSQISKEREDFKKQLTLFTRPLREAQKKFSTAVNDAITGIDENQNTTDTTEGAVPLAKTG